MIGYIKGRGLPVEFPNFHMTCPYLVDLYLLMLTSWYRACVVGMNIAVLISEWEKNTNIALRQLRQLIYINHPRLPVATVCVHIEVSCVDNILPEKSLDRWKKMG